MQISRIRKALTATATMAFVVLLLACRSVAADEIRAADNAVSAGFGFTNLDYHETGSGQTLDTEKGMMPTFDVSAGLLADDEAAGPLGNLYLHLDGQATIGETRYNGAICDQHNNCPPYIGNTDDQIYSTALQLGHAFAVTKGMLLIPYAETGERFWRRGLTGPGGYTENYWNADAMGGLKLQSYMKPWLLSLSGSAGTTFDSYMTTSSTRYNLGDTAIWRIEGEIDTAITDRLDLTTTLSYESFGFGASAVNRQGYYEPDSTTQETTVLFGIAYRYF